MARSTYSDDSARSPTPTTNVDLRIPWNAQLIQPRSVMSGSRQDVVLQIQGPVMMDGEVLVGIGDNVTQVDKWMPGAWTGPLGQRRIVRSVTSHTLRPGVYRALVKMKDGVRLDAGKVIVT